MPSLSLICRNRLSLREAATHTICVTDDWKKKRLEAKDLNSKFALNIYFSQGVQTIIKVPSLGEPGEVAELSLPQQLPHFLRSQFLSVGMYLKTL